MDSLNIYSDTPFDEKALDLLKAGIGSHSLVFPEKMAESVLGRSVAGPEFDTAEIAFGQPDAERVVESAKLKWFHVSTAGYTRYDTPEFRKEMAARGIPVTNSSSVYSDACVDHVFSFMLAQCRQLVPNLASSCAAGTEEWFGLRDSAVPIRGQKVVILGYGTIAKRLVEVLAPWDMEVVALRRSPKGDEGVKIVTPDQLTEELKSADHIINILPDNAASAKFMNEQRLSQMKAGSVFYNIGRGGTVDQQALADALNSEHLGAAWLDVTDPEPLPDDHVLRAAKNCHITPHTAGGHREESVTLVKHFLANLKRFEAGEPLLDRII